MKLQVIKLKNGKYLRDEITVSNNLWDSISTSNIDEACLHIKDDKKSEEIHTNMLKEIEQEMGIKLGSVVVDVGIYELNEESIIN
ncbi:MAG: hypothetical protein R3Y05_01135 [bacterium]